MAIIKKDTISREGFEILTAELKRQLRSGTDPELIIRTITDAEHQLIKYVDEKDAELFRIPEWLNQDVTVTVQAKEIK